MTTVKPYLLVSAILIALFLTLIPAPASTTHAAGTGSLWGYIYIKGKPLTRGPIQMCIENMYQGWRDCHTQTLSSPWYYRANLREGNMIAVSIQVPGTYGMQFCNTFAYVRAGKSIQFDCRVG